MREKDTFFILSFAFISFLIFLPQYISDKIIGWLDMIYYFVPFKEIITENLKRGIMPLWNPYIYCGQPLLANFQSAVFYPLNIFYYAFPIDIAFKINTFLIYFIMSAFFYKFFRQMDLTEEASFVSSFLFSFTSYMTIRAAEWADLHTIAWFPVAVYFSRMALNKNRMIDNLLAIIALSMSFLSGHPQVFIYVFLLFTAFYFYWAGFKGYKRYFIYFLFLFLITAVQILPTMEFTNLSSRTSEYKLFYDAHSNLYMKFDHLIQIFFPFIKKFFSEESSFLNWMALIDIGIGSLLLATFGIAKLQDIKLKDFLLVLFAIFFIISFLKAIPYYDSIYKKLFFLQYMRYPAKINVIFFFILCFFAGAGFDILFKINYKDKRGFLFFVIILNIIFIFIFILLYYGKIFILKIYIKHFNPGRDFEYILNNVYSYDMFLNDAMIFLIILFLFLIVLYFIIQKNIHNYLMKIILVIFIIISVFVYNKPNYGNYVRYNDFNGETKISKFLKNQDLSNKKRILAPLMKKHVLNIIKKGDVTVEEKFNFTRSTMQPNISFFYRFYNLDGFDSLIIAGTYDFIIKINKYNNPWDNDMFALTSTKYIFSMNPIKGVTIKKVFFDDEHNIYLYEKKNVPDIVYFVPLKYAVYVNNKEEEFNELYNKKYVYNKKIVIDKKYKEEFDKYLQKKLKKTDNKIWFERKNINNLSVNINNNMDGFVVISENFYPGWTAKVNGIKRKIIKVNGFFKGVFLESGKNVLELEYKPIILNVGFMLSLFVILFLLIAILFRRTYERT